MRRARIYLPEKVYAIGATASSVVKIGRTNDLERRLRQLQPGNPAPLKVLWATDGSSLLEGGLHRWFESCRLHGEWFDLGDVDPVATIDTAAKEIKLWWSSVAVQPATSQRSELPANPSYAHLRPPKAEKEAS